MIDPPAPSRSTRRGLLSGLAACFCSALCLGAAGEARAQRPFDRRLDLGPAIDEPGWRRRRAIERFHSKGPEFRDRVIDARRSGRLRPIRELNAALRARGFELLDADVYETESGWVYDIRVLGPAGRVRDVLVDGRTLRLIPGR